MRFLAIALILLSFPLLCAWLRRGRRQRLWAYAALGLLPFTVNAWNLDAALVNWAMWPGYSKGVVITVLDALALAIVVTHRAPGRRTTPLVGWLAAYWLAVCVSVAMSETPMASFFYAFQIGRMLLLFVAVARIAADRDALRWIAFGLAAGMIFQSGFALWQRAGGAAQAAGTLGHQNLLGMMAHFVTLPLLAMLLGGERSNLIKLGLFASLLTIALGASRGAIGFAGFGIAALLLLSLVRRASPHKWKVLGLVALVLTVTAPLMYASLENRFEVQGEASGKGEERLAFERAAVAIWADYPMGIGANMYVVTSNTKGYSERAGVNWNYASRSTNVHHAWLLAASETGYLGLITIVALFAAVIVAGLGFAFRYRRDSRGELALGCAVAWGTAAAHNFVEWIFVLYQTQYVAAIAAGVIAGLAREAKLRKRAARTPAKRRPGDESELGEAVLAKG